MLYGPCWSSECWKVHELFDKGAVTGARIQSGQNIFAVDFPGLDPLADHRSRFVKFGQMNNLFVYVVSYMMGPLQKAMEKHQTCSATNL